MAAFWPSGTASAPAQQMPDPSLINGKALPAPELPNGTVTVRVVRESIGNNISGQPVDADGRRPLADRLHRRAGARPVHRTSRPATEGRAETTVDGETLRSDPFTVPSRRRPARHSRGGHRQGRRAQGGRRRHRRWPRRRCKGTVVLRRQQPRAAAVFRRRAAGLLRARRRQQRPQPRRHRRPARHRPAARHERRHGARGLVAVGHRERATASPWPGPSPPGTTSVQVAYRLAYDSGTVTLAQRVPGRPPADHGRRPEGGRALGGLAAVRRDAGRHHAGRQGVRARQRGRPCRGHAAHGHAHEPAVPQPRRRATSR